MLRSCRTEAFTPSALRRCVCPCWSVYKKHKVGHSAATMNTDDVPTGLELSAVLVKEEEAGGLESEETEPAEAEESKPIAAAEGDELLDDEASTPASVNVEIPYDDDRAIPRFSLRRAVKFAGAPRFTVLFSDVCTRGPALSVCSASSTDSGLHTASLTASKVPLKSAWHL